MTDYSRLTVTANVGKVLDIVVCCFSRSCRICCLEASVMRQCGKNITIDLGKVVLLKNLIRPKISQQVIRGFSFGY
jgi:hypothetical protein